MFGVWSDSAMLGMRDHTFAQQARRGLISRSPSRPSRALSRQVRPQAGTRRLRFAAAGIDRYIEVRHSSPLDGRLRSGGGWASSTQKAFSAGRRVIRGGPGACSFQSPISERLRLACKPGCRSRMTAVTCRSALDGLESWLGWLWAIARAPQPTWSVGTRTSRGVKSAALRVPRAISE